MGVLPRVVEDRDRLELRSRLQWSWFRESVGELPVEVVIDPQQRFYFRRRMHNVVAELFPPQMQMREEAEQQRVIRNCAAGFDTVRRVARWNPEVAVGQLHSEHALFRWLLCEDHADTGLIRGRFPVCRVVHLEDQIGAFWDQLRHSFRPFVW